MGISGAGVLLMLVLSYIAQTPRLIKRLGLAGLRLDLRARTFTGFALALLLLSLGFFLAGVPLDGSQPAGVAEAEATLPVTEGEESGALADSTENGETAVPNTTPDGTSRPESGAFGGPPPAARTATAEAALAAEAIVEETTAEATSIPENTETPTPTTTPSPTPSPTPTMTPTPTQTPTPIFEDTAIINIGSSTLWLKRTPGGQDDHLVRGGDVVILLSGHANMGGTMWREVQTVDGVVGWVLDSYLAIDEDVSS